MFGFDDEIVRAFGVLFCVCAVCVGIQRFCRQKLERDQYYYIKDISLVGAWALCGIWTENASLRLVIAAGVLAALIGFCQKVARSWDLRPFYLLIGVWLAVSGPRISFLGLPRGEFFFLSDYASIALSSLWLAFFPILFQEIDEIPGLAGIILLISWVLMLVLNFFSSQNLNDALFLSIAGLSFVLVFSSRHIHTYQRLGEPLAALWGTLLAGTSVLGVSKGVAFSTLMLLPLGLFALPILEISLNVVSAAIRTKPLGSMILYRKLVGGGMDHSLAVYTVAGTCAAAGGLTAWIQLSSVHPLIIFSVLMAILLAGLLFLSSSNASATSPRRARIWNVSVDNVSSSYALGKVQGWIHRSGDPEERKYELARMIVTVDALAALRSRTDSLYAQIVEDADLVLADGRGLLWGLRFLGMPIKERVAGIDFMEQLCRQAAAEKWPVFFYGGMPGVAEAAAAALEKKYPALMVTGVVNGFVGQTQAERDNLARAIRLSGAKLLFVGLGVPRQEVWIERERHRLGPLVAMGVGGSMDVLSGNLRRAPGWMQRAGLEWFYRTIQEPWRWKRVVKLPYFVAMVLATRFRYLIFKRS